MLEKLVAFALRQRLFVVGGTLTLVVLGLVALGAHFSRGVARVLKAVELLKD